MPLSSDQLQAVTGGYVYSAGIARAAQTAAGRDRLNHLFDAYRRGPYAVQQAMSDLSNPNFR